MTAVAEYVITNAEVMRARAVLVECYRRLTDYPTPACVVRQIMPEIEALEAWIASGKPHVG
jgi:hypothetical protein